MLHLSLMLMDGPTIFLIIPHCIFWWKLLIQSEIDIHKPMSMILMICPWSSWYMFTILMICPWSSRYIHNLHMSMTSWYIHVPLDMFMIIFLSTIILLSFRIIFSQSPTTKDAESKEGRGGLRPFPKNAGNLLNHFQTSCN